MQTWTARVITAGLLATTLLTPAAVAQADPATERANWKRLNMQVSKVTLPKAVGPALVRYAGKSTSWWRVTVDPGYLWNRAELRLKTPKGCSAVMVDVVVESINGYPISTADSATSIRLLQGKKRLSTGIATLDNSVDRPLTLRTPTSMKAGGKTLRVKLSTVSSKAAYRNVWLDFRGDCAR